MRKFLLLATICFFSITSFSYALEVGTHQAINEYIVKHTINGFSLDSYLKTHCGIAGGINEYFNPGRFLADYRRAWEWIRDGGRYEDEPPGTFPYTRSLNHFHDPLEPWSTAGFKGLSLSSIVWSQMPKATQYPGGHYSWFDTMGYFHDAVTSTSASDRSRYFAETFRGIGQLMHLVEDASVPAHTRDDAHVFGYHYELAVDKFRNSKDPEEKKIFGDAVANPMTFDPSILAGLPNSLAPIPIARIFDTDQYALSNPDYTVTLGSDIGLSEYSNANFFSEDTIFKDYPHPTSENTNYESFALLPISIVTTGYGVPHNAFYVEGYGKKHLAGLKYFAQEMDGLGVRYDLQFTLDDRCYKDYAKDLLPRAVGYAAGLLNYFFRGSVAISLPSSGFYAQATPDQGFTKLTLLAQDTTSTGELMDNGTIELVVTYRLAYDDPFKNYPESYDFQAAPEYSYIVVPEANGVRSIPRDSPVELTFDLSDSPLPLYAIDVNLQLVYHGRLGMEDGAVVTALKDISEPTPVDIMNDMDLICLDGNFYTSGSQDAIDHVDSNHDGIPEWDIYPHNLTNIYIKESPANEPAYASATSYDYNLANLDAGQFTRAFYVLTDNEFNYSSYPSWINADQRDPWATQPVAAALYPGVGITNQTYYVDDAAACAPDPAPCHIWWYPTFLTYKNHEMWWGSGILYINNAYPQDTECSCYIGILRTCPEQQASESLSSTSSLSLEGGQSDVSDNVKKGNTHIRRMIKQGTTGLSDSHL